MTNSSTEMTDVEQLFVATLPATDPAIGRALWHLAGARARLKENLEKVDPSWIEWEPYPGGNSISTLLYHIALIETDWLCVEVLEQKEYPAMLQELLPYPDRDENGRLYQITGISLAEHLQRLDKVRHTLLDAYATITLDDFRRMRYFPQQYAVTPEWVLFHLTQHETEHRGQIQEIMALAKIK